MSDIIKRDAFYIYLRNNEWFQFRNVYKAGVTEYLVERGGTYITGEPEPGEFVFVVRVSGDINLIDDLFKK